MKNNKLFKVAVIISGLFLLVIFKKVITFDYCSYSDIRGAIFCVLNLVLCSLFVLSPLLFIIGIRELIEEKKILINFSIILSFLGFILFLFIYFPLIIVSNPVLP